jgi:hypothetical protein
MMGGAKLIVDVVDGVSTAPMKNIGNTHQAFVHLHG